MGAKVKKIVIEVGKREMTLSPKEAEELRDVLNEVLGQDRITTLPYPVSVERPIYPYWRRQYWTTLNVASPARTQGLALGATNEATYRIHTTNDAQAVLS